MEDPIEKLRNLVDKANDFDIDSKIPAVRYLRSSREMERMATVYSSENQFENGFLLFMKLITLLVEKLPKHPSYKSLTPEQKKQLKQRCKTALSAAEKLKQSIKHKYEAEFKLWEKTMEEKKKKDDEAQEKALAALSIQSETLENDVPAAPVVGTVAEPTPPFNSIDGLSGYTYPTIPNAPHSEPHKSVDNTQFEDCPSAYPSAPPFNEVLPPRYDGTPPPSYDDAVPHYEPTPYVPFFDRSNKPDLSRPQQPPPASATQWNTTPQVHRDAKPQDMLFRQVSDSLDGNRKVVIPSDLIPRFLEAVAPNTNRNLETCGILNGTLSKNVLRVTHLVIPKQSATSDSCTTENEEELFDVQDKYDTITLGWIHTHPSQTAFLSSVDLHTQCSYQQLMPEAIAIVCAPKYNTTGIYRLTPDHGLRFVASCTKTGFHPHPKNPPLFE